MSSLPVVWDAQRIEQLFGNLLTNAIRYTDAPGEVAVRLTADEAQVHVTVEDSAPGVPENHLAQLFIPLHRVEEARDRASGGSGLGLAVSKAIVAAHRGAISAAPSPLGGLAITVTLPMDAG